MAWEGVQFRDRHGNLVSEKTRETMLSLIERALGMTEADPEVLINTASRVCAKLGSIRNIAAYANRALFRATRRSQVAEKRLAERLEPIQEDSTPVCERLTAPLEPVERQILLEEMLSNLSGQDRDIHSLHLKGFSFAEIDKKLNLKPRTSEYRYREAQERLRKHHPPRS